MADRHTRRPALGEGIVAVAVLGLSALMAWQATQIPVTPGYARIGPTVAPYIAAVALALLGAVLAVQAFRGGWQSVEEKEARPDKVALAWVIGGLVMNVALIGTAGFTIASVVMFVCIARAFGSRAILRDAAIAVAFALLAYFGFAKALGINIGAGFVETAIESLIGGAR